MFAWYDPLRGPGSAWDPEVAADRGTGRSREPRPPRNRTRPRHQRVRLIRFDIDRGVWRERGISDEPTGGSPAGTARFASLQALVRASEYTFVLPAATEILGRREHAAGELRRKLRRKGFSGEACAYAVDTLADRGYQSDDRFADAWIRSRLRGRGVGRTALIAGLIQKGVDRDRAEAAVNRYAAEHPGCFAEALRQQIDAAGGMPAAGRDRDRLVRRLLRKGFSFRDVKEFFA